MADAGVGPGKFDEQGDSNVVPHFAIGAEAIQLYQDFSRSRLGRIEHLNLGGDLARFIVYGGFVLLGNFYVCGGHCGEDLQLREPGLWAKEMAILNNGACFQKTPNGNENTATQGHTELCACCNLRT